MMLNRIVNDWHIDAWQEDEKYFYFVEEIKSLLSGKICFVIGSKGSGKSSISKNFHTHNKENIKVENVIFDDHFSDIKNLELDDPHKMKIFWKYIIYSKICYLILENGEMTPINKKKFKPLFRSNRITDLISRIDVESFSFNLFGISAKLRFSKASKIPMSELIDIMEQIIQTNPVDKSYYIFFDYLDSEYRNENIDLYIKIIRGLFEAIYAIKIDMFKSDNGNQYKICPVAFIREDIYSRILYNDRNKWNCNAIKLKWNESTIEDILNFKICAINNSKSSSSFKESWLKICSDRENKNGGFEGFKTICQLTQLRPRDFIMYLQCAAKIALKAGCKKIHKKEINDAEKEFSQYLYKEIVDEIHVYLPRIDEVLSILQEINSETNKQEFSVEEFRIKYEEKFGIKPELTYKETLNLLFKYNIIGNIPDNHRGYFFHYRNNQININYNQKIVIHKGLKKALQIYREKIYIK